MKRSITFTILLSTSLFISACENNDSSIENNLSKQSDVKIADGNKVSHSQQVSSVNDYPFMYNESENGGIINFKSTEKDCSLSFATKILVAGYHEKLTTPDTGNFEISCADDTENYYLTDSSTSNAQLSIIDSNTIHIEFNLVGFNNEKMLLVDKINLLLSNEQLALLKTVY